MFALITWNPERIRRFIVIEFVFGKVILTIATDLCNESQLTFIYPSVCQCKQGSLEPLFINNFRTFSTNFRIHVFNVA